MTYHQAKEQIDMLLERYDPPSILRIIMSETCPRRQENMLVALNFFPECAGGGLKNRQVNAVIDHLDRIIPEKGCFRLLGCPFRWCNDH